MHTKRIQQETQKRKTQQGHNGTTLARGGRACVKKKHTSVRLSPGRPSLARPAAPHRRCSYAPISHVKSGKHNPRPFSLSRCVGMICPTPERCRGCCSTGAEAVLLPLLLLLPLLPSHPRHPRPRRPCRRRRGRLLRRGHRWTVPPPATAAAPTPRAARTRRWGPDVTETM